MKRLMVFTLAALMVLGMTGSAFATHGYQLIGIGQQQKSMGGAVTAAPVDAMTAISNPAGMARIGNRADFSMEAFMPKRSVDFGNMGGNATEGGTELYGIPSIGWTAPALGRDDVYFGGGMFATSGLGVDFGEVTMMPGAAIDGMNEYFKGLAPGTLAGTHDDVTFDGHTAIQFWKMAPTVAWNVNDRLSVGAALNMDYQSVTITERIRNVPFWVNPMNANSGNPSDGTTPMTVSLDLGRPTSQMGFGASMGMLYDINDKVTVGASYTTEQMFSEAEYRVGTGDVAVYGGAMGQEGIYTMDMDYPQQFSVGVAVKPIEKLLVSADVKWINWSGTHDSIPLVGPSDSFDTNGDGVGDSDSTDLEFGWDDQFAYSLGVQYQATDALVVRCGYSFAESPIDEADVFNNMVFPAIVEQHFTIGAHYELGAHWGIGLTYMKAFSEEIEGKGDVPAGFQFATPFGEDSGAVIGLEEDSLGMQLSYRF